MKLNAYNYIMCPMQCMLGEFSTEHTHVSTITWLHANQCCSWFHLPHSIVHCYPSSSTIYKKCLKAPIIWRRKTTLVWCDIGLLAWVIPAGPGWQRHGSIWMLMLPMSACERALSRLLKVIMCLICAHSLFQHPKRHSFYLLDGLTFWSQARCQYFMSQFHKE